MSIAAVNTLLEQIGDAYRIASVIEDCDSVDEAIRKLTMIDHAAMRDRMDLIGMDRASVRVAINRLIEARDGIRRHHNKMFESLADLQRVLTDMQSAATMAARAGGRTFSV